MTYEVCIQIKKGGEVIGWKRVAYKETFDEAMAVAKSFQSKEYVRIRRGTWWIYDSIGDSREPWNRSDTMLNLIELHAQY